MTRGEQGLTWILRFGGVVTGSAVFAIFLPDTAMESIHAALGMGALPEAPITLYLTRSLSALYAFHGLILFALSRDVRRYRGVIVAVAWGTLALGVTQIGIDLHAGIPDWWTWVEGPSVVVIGLALITLLRSVPRS